MQIIYIHHSCFLVEVDEKVLIFDYFDGNHVKDYPCKGKIPNYAPDTPIYMFASHSHQDHYDMDILRWAEQYTNIHYIFSKEIQISPNFLKKHGIDPKVRDRVTFVRPDKSYAVDDLSIRTFRSTDAGVAFYVDVKGVSLFHAGDLNDWRWEGVGDLINGKMGRDFRYQIRKLADLPLNIAFFPLDPRLGMHQDRGLRFFLETTRAEYVFPMHMWQDYSGIQLCKKQISSKEMAERIVEISRENQSFMIGEK